MHKGQTNSGTIFAAIIGAIGVIIAAYIAGTNNPKSEPNDSGTIAIQQTQVALANKQSELQATVIAGSNVEALNAQATQQAIQEERNKLEQQLTSIASSQKTPLITSGNTSSNPENSVTSQPLSRCDWLLANFPQTVEDISTKFALPKERISLLSEGCDHPTAFVVNQGADITGSPELNGNRSVGVKQRAHVWV